VTGGLEGRTALVIGANGGIGEAISAALAGLGARLVLAARDTDRLEATRRRIADAGTEVRVRSLDVTDDSAVHELVAGTGDLHVAVNNAGVSHRPAPLPDLALDEADRVLAVSLRATLVAMRLELAVMREGGSLVNVVSSAGLRGAPGMAAYVAAKHGVVGLTRTAALDMAERGIRVNAVAPGPIESGTVLAQPQEVRDRIGTFVPLGRMGTPAEVAAAVAWLASPESSYVTGTVLEVSGGKGAGGA
jgi:NAD(P)-dependent dehydrogenase (short-subunit alcohol dehydrogenase family)